MSRPKKIAVLGAGSWGTALASHLANNGLDVCLWARSARTADSISRQGENADYLPGIALCGALRCSVDPGTALDGVSDVLIAVPSHSFSGIVERTVEMCGNGVGIVWACKGLDPDTGEFLSEVLEKIAGVDTRHAIISGPTFAAELAAGLPTAIAVASNRDEYARTVGEWLHNERFRAYTTSDIKGVQIGGALKNIYAIAAGISDGLRFGANARVALITRGLAEMTRLGESLGAERSTLTGLSGVGDLILTCTDNQSRNRQFGLALAEGLTVESALQRIGQAVEGLGATRAARKLAHRYQVDMPIVDQVYEVVENGKPAHCAVESLLSRSRKNENS